MSDNKDDNVIFNDYKPDTSSHDDDNNEMINKFYVNFIGISVSCMYYAQQFLSNNKLHKYIREGYSSKDPKIGLLVFQKPPPTITCMLSNPHTIV